MLFIAVGWNDDIAVRFVLADVFELAEGNCNEAIATNLAAFAGNAQRDILIDRDI